MDGILSKISLLKNSILSGKIQSAFYIRKSSKGQKQDFGNGGMARVLLSVKTLCINTSTQGIFSLPPGYTLANDLDIIMYISKTISDNKVTYK